MTVGSRAGRAARWSRATHCASRAGGQRLVVARSNRYTHDDLRAHVISVGNDGRPRASGALGNTAADIARIVGDDVKAATEAWDARRVLLYAHGGLGDEDFDPATYGM